KFYNLSSLVVGARRGQDRMHPVADAQSLIGRCAQDRSQRRAVIEDDHADREGRLKSFAATILMHMDSGERMQLAVARERSGFEVASTRAANFASVGLRRKEHVSAFSAAAAV